MLQSLGTHVMLQVRLDAWTTVVRRNHIMDSGGGDRLSNRPSDMYSDQSPWIII